VSILGLRTARRRLRRATEESLLIPPFSPSIDCTPWVTGGLWPEELATVTAETAALASCLDADLRRIARNANIELRLVRGARLPDFAREAQETRIIGEARARAAQRVHSTVRDVRAMHAATRGPRRGPLNDPVVGRGIDTTQVMPAVTGVAPLLDSPRNAVSLAQNSNEVNRADAPIADPAASGRRPANGSQTETSTGRHRASEEDGTAAVTRLGAAGSARHRVPEPTGPDGRDDRIGTSFERGHEA
jgi:hypothetical protein